MSLRPQSTLSKKDTLPGPACSKCPSWGDIRVIESQDRKWLKMYGSWRVRRLKLGLTSCQALCFYLPRSSEKLIPSLIFPPTTQNKTAPFEDELLTAKFCRYKKSRKWLIARTICWKLRYTHNKRKNLQRTLMEAAYDERTWSSWLAFLGSRNTYSRLALSRNEK